MKLTANFSLSEFECKCGCEMPDNVLENVKLLAENLQMLRMFIKQPIKVNSAYRCLSHNKNIGSKDTSQHVLGKAADIVVNELKPNEVADIAEQLMDKGLFKMGGVGRYNTFTHVDIRGKKARW
ncbi:D-Ala-D-Ala carboxypeptidase family metallohydrolase [uncultured Polaribacter sp.]|uniref:YcbK family protein n=1 Tax=uncultured Polaribacter sp. TaxID=174711 RepID=UPI00259B04E4|nr:D-Ala-D-Ala carboxypeptidase family metallohydrolase [uncultured Polaribacter sp.]